MSYSGIDVDSKDPILNGLGDGVCPTGCGRRCPHPNLVCFVCWKQVPTAHRQAVTSTYRAWWRGLFRSGDVAALWETHQNARAAALEAIQTTHEPTRRTT